MRVTHNIDSSVIGKITESAVKEAAESLADYVMDVTVFDNDRQQAAVDTGAFITSWSFSVGRGRPRGVSSRRKPRNQNPLAKAREGRALLQQDIEKMEFDKVKKAGFIIRNGAPHAQYIDLKHFYGIEARIRAWQP